MSVSGAIVWAVGAVCTVSGVVDVCAISGVVVSAVVVVLSVSGAVVWEGIVSRISVVVDVWAVGFVLSVSGAIVWAVGAVCTVSSDVFCTLDAVWSTICDFVSFLFCSFSRRSDCSVICTVFSSMGSVLELSLFIKFDTVFDSSAAAISMLSFNLVSVVFSWFFSSSTTISIFPEILSWIIFISWLINLSGDNGSLL